MNSIETFTPIAIKGIESGSDAITLDPSSSGPALEALKSLLSIPRQDTMASHAPLSSQDSSSDFSEIGDQSSPLGQMPAALMQLMAEMQSRPLPAAPSISSSVAEAKSYVRELIEKVRDAVQSTDDAEFSGKAAALLSKFKNLVFSAKPAELGSDGEAKLQGLVEQLKSLVNMPVTPESGQSVFHREPIANEAETPLFQNDNPASPTFIIEPQRVIPLVGEAPPAVNVPDNFSFTQSAVSQKPSGESQLKPSSESSFKPVIAPEGLVAPENDEGTPFVDVGLSKARVTYNETASLAREILLHLSDETGANREMAAAPASDADQPSMESSQPQDVPSLGTAILQSLDQQSAPVQTSSAEPTLASSGIAHRIAEMSDLISSMADRVLVTDPLHGPRQEVHIKLADTVLDGAEVRVWREDGGQLRVQFETASAYWSRVLNDALPQLSLRLQERLPPGTEAMVMVQHQGQQPEDGRSRNRHNPWELAQQFQES